MSDINSQSEETRRASARVGTTLKGKYRLDRVLGIGGMAVVYAATHRNQAEFAVKMLHPELSYNTDVRTRFLREGYAANSVKHSGVVMVVDDDVAEDGAAFLVMELLRGQGVEEIWEKSRLRVAPRVAVAIVDQLLDVLAAAHDKGIVHRDIKPANLFVTHEGVVKVLDFGIARARDALAGTDGNRTGTGMLLGTPAFMAPEQALAKSSDIDAQTDVWAAGATLFSLVSGQYVHTGENAPQLLVNAATKPARSFASVAQAPPEIVEVVDRALAFEKGARFRSAGGMREALRDAARRAFGSEPSREWLTQPSDVNPLAATALPVMQSSPSASPSSAATPFVPFSGGTTAQPVLSDVPGVTKAKSASAVVIVVGAVVAVAGIGFGLNAIRSRSQSTAPDTLVAPTSATPSASASSAPMAIASASSSTSAVSAATPSGSSDSASVPTPARDTHRAPHPRASQAATSSPPTPSVAPPSVAKPSCDPPFFFDGRGRKVFKPECL
jgi:serine/threonine-protein kinase